MKYRYYTVDSDTLPLYYKDIKKTYSLPTFITDHSDKATTAYYISPLLQRSPHLHKKKKLTNINELYVSMQTIFQMVLINRDCCLKLEL